MERNNMFVGTRSLVKFILRIDRIGIILWVTLFSLFNIGLVPVFENLLKTSTDNLAMIEIMKNPAMIAIVGPIYGESNYSLGAAYSNYMFLFAVMIASTMNIFLVAKHTRKDEEMGRVELLNALPIGRLSNLFAVYIVAAFVNICLCLFTAGGLFALGDASMTLIGCLSFGISLGVVGMFFAAVTAILCQIVSSNRLAVTMSFIFMLLLYILRGIGDLGNESLSLISPLGLILRTEVFVNNYFMPIIMLKLVTIIAILLSFFLAISRDLGRGIFSERRGRAHGLRLFSSPMGLALKLIKGPIITWAIVIFAMAAMYGSVLGDLESYMKSSDMLSAIFSKDPKFSLTTQFMALLSVIMSLVSTVPLLTFINRISVEENNNLVEHLFSRWVNRGTLVKAYLLPTMIASVIYQVLSALGFWIAGSMVLESISSLGTFLLSSLILLPAMWVIIAVSILLIGISPRFAWLTYLYLGYSFVAIYFGRLADLPDIVKKFSPFGYIAQYPVEEINWVNIILLTGISILLTTIGLSAYKRRDIKF